MKDADAAYSPRRRHHFLRRDREDVADEHVLQVLASGRRLAHRQNRRRRRHRVGDADDRLLRNPRLLAADRREQHRAQEREGEADPVDGRPVRIAARDRQQQGNGRPERRNLRERQVDEDDSALDHVHAEIRVDAGDDQARQERPLQKLESCGVERMAASVPRALRPDVLERGHEHVDVEVEKLDVIGDLFSPPTDGGMTSTFAPVWLAMEFGVF